MSKRRRDLAIAACALVAAGSLWAYLDYRAWLRLGEGGVRANLKGWMNITRLRLRMRDPLDVTEVRTMQGTGDDVAMLTSLPPRSTARPRVGRHPVPHRQMSQHADTKHRRALQDLFDRTVAAHGGDVRYALSHFERHVRAITCARLRSDDPVGGSSHGEIAHVHDSDGSMHMILSPSDAVVAIEAGWAQLHGLAGRAYGLPRTYVMVYAGRDDAELAVIDRLLRASIAYMLGTREAESLGRPAWSVGPGNGTVPRL